jgi:hypothetical protein
VGLGKCGDVMVLWLWWRQLPQFSPHFQTWIRPISHEIYDATGGRFFRHGMETTNKHQTVFQAKTKSPEGVLELCKSGSRGSTMTEVSAPVPLARLRSTNQTNLAVVGCAPAQAHERSVALA